MMCVISCQYHGICDATFGIGYRTFQLCVYIVLCYETPYALRKLGLSLVILLMDTGDTKCEDSVMSVTSSVMMC